LRRAVTRCSVSSATTYLVFLRSWEFRRFRMDWVPPEDGQAIEIRGVTVVGPYRDDVPADRPGVVISVVLPPQLLRLSRQRMKLCLDSSEGRPGSFPRITFYGFRRAAEQMTGNVRAGKLQQLVMISPFLHPFTTARSQPPGSLKASL
jgi:hypothetical protein